MALTIYQPIVPDGNFHAVEAADVLMTDGTRLSEFNPGSGLPEVTEADNGKVLVAMNGAWVPVAVEIPEGLPDSTEADNGKVLQVVNGVPQYVSVSESAVAAYIDDYISSALDGDY